jgi:PmbA protein
MKIDQDFAEDIIKEARKRGGFSVEVYMTASSSTSIDVKGQEIEALERADEFGYSLRVIGKDRIGFSYSTEPDKWLEVVEAAITNAAFTDEDPFSSLAEPETAPSVLTHDHGVSELTDDSLLEKALEIEKAALDHDRRIRKVRKASAAKTESEVLVMTSTGVSLRYAGTALSGQIMVVAEDGEDSQMGWGFESSRLLSDIDFPAIGSIAAERAIQLLGAGKAETGRGDILLESHVATELLGILASAFSSENIQKGKSLLAGRRDEKVFSERLNLIDDPTLEGRPGSRPFDGEGTPSRRIRLVTEGVVSNFLYNIRTAKREGLSSTGNAVRAGIESLPGVGISNLFIEPASGDYCLSREALIGSMKRGIIVTEAMGMHTANPISGDFSVGITGLWVEEGRVVRPVKEAAISGNIQDLFRKIVAFGDRTKFYGRTGSPDILFEDIDISG